MAKKPDEEIKLQTSSTAPKVDYTTKIRTAMNNGESAGTVEKLWNQRQAHVDRNEELEQYRFDGYDDVLQYIYDNQPAEKVQTYGNFKAGTAPTYYDDYKARTDELLHNVLNRPAFSYDAESDPLYQQYKTQYQREGERSMKNTLGEVSARTGGLASSYAVAAAQDANNYYNAQLADKIPELQQLAYSMYLDEGNVDRQNLGLLQDMSNTAYGRYRDTLGDWYSNRDFSYNTYRDEIADDRYDTEWEYNLGRDALADQRYDTEWEYNVGRDALDDEWRQKEWDYNVAQAAKAASSRSSGGGSGGSGGSGGGKDALVAAVADIAGVSYETALALKNNGSTKWPAMLEKAGFSAEEAAAVADDSGNDEPELDMASVLNLGYGPISESRLASLVQSGEVEMYVEGGKTKFRRATNSGGYFNRPY